jgi:hypothetical protein
MDVSIRRTLPQISGQRHGAARHLQLRQPAQQGVGPELLPDRVDLQQPGRAQHGGPDGRRVNAAQWNYN